jgi:UDP-GlcNAc3NAcA epimerase
MSAQKNLLMATVVGARPQFIKAAVVSRALRSTSGTEEILVHTGQHYDENMSDVFFEELEIPHPDIHLGVGSGSHAVQTGQMLEKLERVFIDEKPDCVLVYGDTNSTLAGALGAAKLHLPVAHVEAGLRSFNRRGPEEINRVLVDHVSNMLFAPTEAAVENLRREGIAGYGVHLVGDVMYDAAMYYGAKAEQMSTILDKLDLAPAGYVLATVHRAENTDDPKRLQAIVGGLRMVAEELPVIMPLHPRTRAALAREGMLEKESQHIRLTDPLGYMDMMMLEKNSRLVATDSGGVQKEAFFYRVPCVTLREETEWVELVELGWNVCVPPKQPSIIYEAIMERTSLSSTLAGTDLPGLYGEGNAGSLIAEHLVGSNLP